MMRTEAPKDRVGRGVVNLARTTPELPIKPVSIPIRCPCRIRGICTVRPGDLAPDDPDLGTADLLLRPVNVCDLLAEVEAIVKSG